MLRNQKKRTKIIDIIEYTLKRKWKWAGHIARLKTIGGQNAAHSGNQGEGRGQKDDKAEDGKRDNREGGNHLD